MFTYKHVDEASDDRCISLASIVLLLMTRIMLGLDTFGALVWVGRLVTLLIHLSVEGERVGLVSHMVVFLVTLWLIFGFLLQAS